MLFRRYNNNKVIGTGGAVLGSAYQLYSPYVRRYGPGAVKTVSKYVSGLRDRMFNSSNRQYLARSAKTSRSRLRGAAVSSGIGKQVPAGGGGESKSNFRLVKPKYKYDGLKLLGKNTVCRSSGISTVSGQGVQSATLLNRIFDVVDITNIFSSVGDSQATAGLRSAKCLLQNGRAKALITNAETTNCHFTIYTVMHTTDTGTNNFDPATTFLAGNIDANNGAAADATIPGTTPYSNPRFVQNYKILQQTSIILSPGMTHNHVMEYSPQRIYSLEKVYSSALLSGGLAGLTVSMFIIQHGTPVHDDTVETSVTFGASKLDIVLLEELQFQLNVREFGTNSITTTLATNLVGFQMTENAPADVADNS